MTPQGRGGRAVVSVKRAKAQHAVGNTEGPPEVTTDEPGGLVQPHPKARSIEERGRDAVGQWTGVQCVP